jgi:hydrogenase, Fe-only
VKAAKESRIASLYERDKLKAIKAPQDNPEIQVLYNEFYAAPLSEKAHHMLHTEGFIDRSADLGPNGACTPETCPTSVANLKKAQQ